VEKYNKYIAGNPKAALIFFSLDRSKDAAEKWAAKVGMPWLTVLQEDIVKSKLNQYSPRAVPTWILIDKDGEKIATGSSVFERVAELTGQEHG